MKKRGVSIAVKMVALLLVIFVFEGMLIGYNVIHGDVLEYMQTNERNIFHERVVNRKNYLEEKMQCAVGRYRRFHHENQQYDPETGGCGKHFTGQSGQKF